MQSDPEDSRQGAVRREWPLPFARTAMPDRILWDANTLQIFKQSGTPGEKRGLAPQHR